MMENPGLYPTPPLRSRVIKWFNAANDPLSVENLLTFAVHDDRFLGVDDIPYQFMGMSLRLAIEERIKKSDRYRIFRVHYRRYILIDFEKQLVWKIEITGQIGW
jgi:hypothetical protein